MAQFGKLSKSVAGIIGRRRFLSRIAAAAGGAAATLGGLAMPAFAERKKFKVCYFVCDIYGETWRSKSISCHDTCPQVYRDCVFQYFTSHGC